MEQKRTHREVLVGMLASPDCSLLPVNTLVPTPLCQSETIVEVYLTGRVHSHRLICA